MTVCRARRLLLTAAEHRPAAEAQALVGCDVVTKFPSGAIIVFPAATGDRVEFDEVIFAVD